MSRLGVRCAHRVLHDLPPLGKRPPRSVMVTLRPPRQLILELAADFAVLGRAAGPAAARGWRTPRSPRSCGTTCSWWPPSCARTPSRRPPTTSPSRCRSAPTARALRLSVANVAPDPGSAAPAELQRGSLQERGRGLAIVRSLVDTMVMTSDDGPDRRADDAAALSRGRGHSVVDSTVTCSSSPVTSSSRRNVGDTWARTSTLASAPSRRWASTSTRRPDESMNSQPAGVDAHGGRPAVDERRRGPRRAAGRCGGRPRRSGRWSAESPSCTSTVSRSSPSRTSPTLRASPGAHARRSAAAARRPVGDLPEGVDPRGLVVEVLQVEGVLPGVDHQDGVRRPGRRCSGGRRPARR